MIKIVSSLNKFVDDKFIAALPGSYYNVNPGDLVTVVDTTGKVRLEAGRVLSIEKFATADDATPCQEDFGVAEGRRLLGLLIKAHGTAYPSRLAVTRLVVGDPDEEVWEALDEVGEDQDGYEEEITLEEAGIDLPVKPFTLEYGDGF